MNVTSNTNDTDFTCEISVAANALHLYKPAAQDEPDDAFKCLRCCETLGGCQNASMRLVEQNAECCGSAEHGEGRTNGGLRISRIVRDTEELAKT